MKLNITIDLEDTIKDMLDEENNDLSSAIQGEILRSVMIQVMPKMKVSIDELVSKRINVIIKDRIEKRVDSILNKALEGDGLITINREQKTVQKHIEDIFNKNNIWNGPNEKIADIANKFSQELKIQYNNLFAMNIVLNLKENGMLKDDIALMLTKEKK